ncbi:MAG TPA: hypothetical protein VIU15_39880 [Streptomyces sp.]
MGMSTDAILAYGYHLGGPDGGWELHGLDKYDELPALPWYDVDDEEGDDFQSAAERHLLVTIADFTETDWRADGYDDRRKAARSRVGVGFETHCSADYPGFLLITKGITVYRGSVKEIDFAALQAEVQEAGADAKLRAALDALGLQPTQERAQWLLCSYWG